MHRLFIGLLMFFLLLNLGCSSKPVLYPNEHYKKVGKDVADKDVEECMAMGEAHVEKKTGKKAAQGLGAGAVIGGAMGAASGIFTRSIASSAIRGATIGGATGAAAGAVSAQAPNEVLQNFVNQCLADKGYRPMGWN